MARYRIVSIATVLALSAESVAGHCAARAKESDSLTVEPFTLRTYDGTEHPTELLSFRVPENRRHPSGRHIRLSCVRLRSTAATPRPPIVFLSGGPGIPATGLAQVPVYYSLFERLRSVSDVLLLDQRGMGKSALPVPPVSVPIPPDVFTSSDKLLAAMERSLAASVEAHRRAGIEVAAYTTVENSDDVDDLRRVLGVERVSVLGFSYGTSLAMVYAARHPTGVHRMVLAGVHGPDRLLERPSSWDSQLAKLTALAARDSGLDPGLANLDSLFSVALAGLRRRELEVRVTDPISGESLPIRCGVPGMLFVLRDRLNDRAIPLLPALLRGFAEADTALLARSLEQAYGTLRSGLSATNLALSVSRGWTRRRWLEVREDSARARMNLVNLQWNPRVRSILGLDATSEFVEPMRCDLPTLFVSGALDSNTPSEDAEQVAKGFPNGVHVMVENGGHETLPATQVQDLIVSFLDERLPASCRVVLPPPKFLGFAEAAARLESGKKR